MDKLKEKVCAFNDDPKTSELCRKVIQLAILEPDLLTAQVEVQTAATFLKNALTNTSPKIRRKMEQLR